MIKTFRGILADGGQDRIRLSTMQGKVGYRIIKFQVVGAAVGTSNYESVSQIWKKEQTSVVATIDFTNSDLLGIGIFTAEHGAHQYPEDMTVIFDSEIFNQDIYITQQCLQSGSVNYYLELEVVPLNDLSAEYTTIKDIRNY
tara:strand:+ start:114 stop:539 length:426 start_codon:yes stop_codon:yes gene_type:complete